MGEAGLAPRSALQREPTSILGLGNAVSHWHTRRERCGQHVRHYEDICVSVVCTLLCSITSTLQEDVKQVVHLLTAQAVLLGAEKTFSTVYSTHGCLTKPAMMYSTIKSTTY